MFFRNPLYVTKGWMQWLWNEKNERFLDLFGGIVTVSVGHCHPRVNAALHKQIDTLWHTTSIYLHPKIHEYAERLVQVRNGLVLADVSIGITVLQCNGESALVTT